MAAELVVVLAAEAEELGPACEERERQPPERRVAPAVPEDLPRRVDGPRERHGARRREPGHVHDFEVRVEPVWKSNFGRPTPSTQRRLRNCICTVFDFHTV